MFRPCGFDECAVDTDDHMVGGLHDGRFLGDLGPRLRFDLLSDRQDAVACRRVVETREVYDLAIGNPPFSDRTVRADDPAGDLRLSLHDYFIARSVEIASWSFNVHAFAVLASSSTDWGTSRRHAGELLLDALNASLLQIYDEFEEDGVKKRVLNAADTEAAKDKLMKIKAAFETWVWKDSERADRLARIYNDRFNNLVPRHFDGSHLTIPGASSVISFYAHQKRAIWRIVASGTTYVAHAVGAGKTFSLAAAIMEQKRLGLITKAMMVVPGHCLAQASREFLQLYPTAQILVADETNFVKDKRQRFLARAATAQWDCIIITHSAFKFIPAPAEFERRLIADQIRSYSDLLERVDGADRLSRKRIERMKEGLEEDLDRVKSRKDDMLRDSSPRKQGGRPRTVTHRQHKGLNNRAENSHQPTRRRERIMKRFKSARQAQRFQTVHDQVANFFHIPYPESVPADFRRASRERAFAVWSEISKTAAIA